MANGFAALGELLGGGADRETPYYEGMYEGSRAQKALAEARLKRDEEVNRVRMEETLRAAGINDPAVLANVMRSGFGNFQQATAGMGNIQEQGFRATAADPNVDPAAANVALRGVASGPVDRFQSVGEGLFADLFANVDAPTVSPLGEASIGQRDAATRYSDERADVTGPLADALIGQRNAAAALSDERRTNPAAFRSPGTTVQLGLPGDKPLGDFLADEFPAQSTVSPDLTREGMAGATGLEGMIRRGVNIGADIIGTDIPFQEVDVAQNAMENLAIAQQTIGQTAIQGRPSNYLMQLLDKRNVNPADIMRGDQRAINRFKQTRGMVATDVQRLQDQLNNPVGFTKADISNTRTSFDVMRNLLADFDAVIGVLGPEPAEGEAVPDADGWVTTPSGVRYRIKAQ